MINMKRTIIDKLKTLFFGKELRITEGEPYTEVRAFDFSLYYPENKYIYSQKAPSENVYDIRCFGADVSSADNSAAINKAIESACKTFGTVLVSGGEYISEGIILKSNVTLFIEKGSAISANDTGSGYNNKALLYAENAENITLTGGGKLKGSGHMFGLRPAADKNNTDQADYIDVIEMRRDYRSQIRFAHKSKYGGVVSFKNCKNIRVDNFIIENSPYWTFKISDCKNADIKNFIINNNRNVANADGIDIAGSSDIAIRHCFISTADDGIVIKNAVWLGNKGAMRGITVSDCEVISRTNAFKIGTETTYDISDISVSDCKFFMTDLYPGSVSGISLESSDGAVVSNVDIKNIEMDRCTCPIFIRLNNRNRASKVNAQSANAVEFGIKMKKKGSIPKKRFDMKGGMKNISISDIKASGVEIPVIIAGFKQRGRVKRVENITLENIDLTYADIPEIEDKRLFIPEYAKDYPESWRFRNLPAFAMWLRHTKNISVKNFNCRHPLPTWKKAIVKTDSLE